MAKINFTASRIGAYCCDSGRSQSFLWDSKTPGLGLRATSSGAKSYIFQAKFHGSSIRVTIGDPQSWTIDQAQERARSLQILIDNGIDPREHAAEKKAAYEARQAAKRREDVTVKEAWDVYLEYLRTKISPKTKKPRSDRYIQDHIARSAPGGDVAKRGGVTKVSGPLWPLMHLKMSDITAGTVADWLEGEIKRRPTNAVQSFAMLRTFIRWCGDHEMFSGVINEAAYSSKKVTGILPRIAAKKDCLENAQLRPWFEAVREIMNPVISAYLQGLLITGARREELAALRWEDVDLQWKRLTLNDKVEGVGGRIIPLTPYLENLLLDLKQRDATSSPWVFPSKKSADGKIAEPRIAHNAALKAAGLPHLTLHGLRRSFGTLSEWVEVPVGIVAQIQGHKPSALIEKHYRQRHMDLLRKWHNKIEAWILEQAGIPFE